MSSICANWTANQQMFVASLRHDLQLSLTRARTISQICNLKSPITAHARARVDIERNGEAPKL